ncbi:hypothetical protein AA13595_0899 [Gluconacetobacter johannae DSM 13595]|uniref:Uncharacterized protein n=1 Tax=Gluconacetobacter johannae TaxID=112140 RepID=A0A7W4P698_9PROT|nr:hypothetical protein [Gluconacetobacter johannae]MBB2177013.1 hypothetical protein [Gluconacetobacter johannae]GBQ82340.1 hypothetical protein AA13595_0899 [Gluconacetobacter johannae DSM 13595]
MTVDHIELCAKIISGLDEPQPALMTTIRSFAGAVAAARMSEERTLKRTELRKRMAPLGDACTTILQALESAELSSWFAAEEQNVSGQKPPEDSGDDPPLQGDPSCLDDEIAAVRFLKKLQLQADALATRIEKGKGNYRSYPNPDGSSAKELCALACAFLWRDARKRQIGKKNPTAWEACDALWLASGGKIKENNQRIDSSGWLDHLQKINRSDTSLFTKKFQKLMRPPTPRLPRRFRQHERGEE